MNNITFQVDDKGENSSMGAETRKTNIAVWQILQAKSDLALVKRI